MQDICGLLKDIFCQTIVLLRCLSIYGDLYGNRYVSVYTSGNPRSVYVVVLLGVPYRVVSDMLLTPDKCLQQV